MSDQKLKTDVEIIKQLDNLGVGQVNKKTGLQFSDLRHCEHCYCGQGTWNNKEHFVCCMCGHRELVGVIGQIK